MTDLDVRMIKLEPMRVASAFGYGPQPEEVAWGKLEAWAGPKGYLASREGHRVFGFNNPSPAASSPNYGYEFWIEVGPEVMPEGEVRFLDFAGGLYAVTRVEVRGDPETSIPAGWKALALWLEDSPYRKGNHQWLEEHLDDPTGFWRLDLYLPVIE